MTTMINNVKTQKVTLTDAQLATAQVSHVEEKNGHAWIVDLADGTTVTYRTTLLRNTTFPKLTLLVDGCFMLDASARDLGCGGPSHAFDAMLHKLASLAVDRQLALMDERKAEALTKAAALFS